MAGNRMLSDEIFALPGGVLATASGLGGVEMVAAIRGRRVRFQAIAEADGAVTGKVIDLGPDQPGNPQS